MGNSINTTHEFKLQIKGKQYQSLQHVSSECSSDRVLLVIHSQVFDLTAFLREHPGGSDILRGLNGKDASQDFDDVHHSSTAYALLDQYIVGYIS
jgi:cytochrome b involved in lipid metabolism